MIKAIETVYNGYRFRSRLEARWAVYFDAIGLKWEYETEGFDLGDGIYYLPDFWFPQVKLWGEVKPEEFSQDELEKAQRLVKNTGKGCIKLIGIPDIKPYNVIDMFDSGNGEVIGETDCIISMYHEYPIKEGRFYMATGVDPENEEELADFRKWVGDLVDFAVEAARQARFEQKNGYYSSNVL